MKVLWASAAQLDRSDIFDYISLDNPSAAIRMDEVFSNAATSLGDQPMLGHPGKIGGTRELIPHENYRLVYEVEDQTVWILALVHVARKWPPLKQ
jgi:addiction module RelE/StbE family toxin